jgi:hypothetical protein
MLEFLRRLAVDERILPPTETYHHILYQKRTAEGEVLSPDDGNRRIHMLPTLRDTCPEAYSQAPYYPSPMITCLYGLSVRPVEHLRSWIPHITRPGFPTTTDPGGMSLVSTAPDPITE